MSRKIVVYLVYISVIIVVLTIIGLPLMWLHEECSRNYILINYYVAQFAAFMFLGILLGFCERFIYEYKKEGLWKVDVPRIIIGGVPIGCLAASYLIYYSNILGFINNISSYMVNTDLGQVVVAQVILGYIIITSFYKKAT